MKRTLKQLAASAVTALGLTLATVPAQAADTIRIGSFLSVTGPASFLGDPEAKTLEIYVKQINEAGGVNGKDLELVVYDDSGDANKARTFATRLVEDDGIVAMVGGSTTGATMAMAEATSAFLSAKSASRSAGSSSMASNTSSPDASKAPASVGQTRLPFRRCGTKSAVG